MKTASLNEREKSPLVSGLAAGCLFTFIFCACVALAFLFARLVTAVTGEMPIVGVIAGFLALGILGAGILTGAIAEQLACRYNGAAVVQGRDFHVAYELAQGSDVVLEVNQASRGLTAPDSDWVNHLHSPNPLRLFQTNGSTTVRSSLRRVPDRDKGLTGQGGPDAARNALAACQRGVV